MLEHTEGPLTISPASKQKNSVQMELLDPTYDAQTLELGQSMQEGINMVGGSKKNESRGCTGSGGDSRFQLRG